MRYLLDTNICIYLINQKPPSMMNKFNEYSVGEIGVSSITVGELWYGVAKSEHRRKNAKALQQFLLPLVVTTFDEGAAEVYGEIRAALEKEGLPIGAMDMLIAAHALSAGVVLVTNNEQEFARVPGLLIENWVKG
ncbi:MAG: type II toxin-antitoxin system VapC family toxin [Anaerolineales bacterium]